MKNDATKNTCKYLEDEMPDFILPKNNADYRYALGRLNDGKSKNPLVVICLNPSAADDQVCDSTIKQIINISKREELKYDGWVVFNLYPERATDVECIKEYNEKLSKENVDTIIEFLKKYEIKEVFGAWGSANHNAIKKGKKDLLEKLIENDIKVFTYSEKELLPAKNPHHILYDKRDFTQKQYVDLKSLL